MMTPEPSALSACLCGNDTTHYFIPRSPPPSHARQTVPRRARPNLNLRPRSPGARWV